MLTDNIDFKNFKNKVKTKNYNSQKILKLLLKKKNHILSSLSNKYKNSYKKKFLDKYKKSLNFRIIGMGGSTLGAQAIYDFLNKKINKKFYFSDNLQLNKKTYKNKKITNLIISKSGNTIETIVNANILIKKKDANIFITEKKKSYLYLLAEKLKAEIIHHNNYIGGRYSVLSEVGMLPAELMGLNASKFRQLNNLVKNKNFLNNLISNVSSTMFLVKKKKI